MMCGAFSAVICAHQSLLPAPTKPSSGYLTGCPLPIALTERSSSPPPPNTHTQREREKHFISIELILVWMHPLPFLSLQECQNLKSVVRRGIDPTSTWDAWSAPKVLFIPGTGLNHQMLLFCIWTVSLTHGPPTGLHLFWHKKRILIMRSTLERSAKTDQLREEITLTVLGNGRAFLASLLNEALHLWETASPANVFVFLPAPSPDDWLLQSKKVGRSLDSVILPSATKENILADSKCFFCSPSGFKSLMSSN